MFHVHTCIESLSIIVTLLYPLYLPSPSHKCPPTPAWLFHILSFLFRYLFVFQWGFCLGILPVNILCLDQSNPLTTFPCLVPCTLYCSTVFSVLFCLVLTQMWCISLYSLCIILFLFSSSLSLLSHSNFWKHVLYIFICIYDNACIYIGSISHMRENMWPLAFWTWLASLKVMVSSSMHLPANNKI
jgi:hypothetical protein